MPGQYTPIINSTPIASPEAITYVFFDIDNCLIVNEIAVLRLLKIPGNLSRVNIRSIYPPVFAINLNSMALIFKSLLAKKINIGFVTASVREAGETKAFFEKLYELPNGALAHAVFINRYDYKECRNNKGLKILEAQQKGKIAANATILAIDDHPECIAELAACGIKAIQACGFPMQEYASEDDQPVRFDINNNYLQEIIDACGLNVILQPSPQQDNHNAVRSMEFSKVLCYERHAKLHRMFADIANDRVPNIKHFIKLLRANELKSLSSYQLELALWALAKFPDNVKANYISGEIIDSLGCRSDWNNYSLNVKGETLWPVLSAPCYISAIIRFSLPLAELLELLKKHMPAERCLHLNALVAVHLENIIFYEIYSTIVPFSQQEEYTARLGMSWNFIAQHGVFDKSYNFKIFIKPNTRKWPMSKEICAALLQGSIVKYDSQEFCALLHAAKHLNSGFILQMLRCKYDNGIKNTDFINRCKDAFRLLVNNEDYPSSAKGAAIAPLLNYMHSFWFFSTDESRLYKDLKNYIKDRANIEPDLDYFINNPGKSSVSRESSVEPVCPFALKLPASNPRARASLT